MYEDMIEVLNPKPAFNLTWYNDADLYSEGEIEDVIVDIIAHNEPEDYVQAIADHYCWSVFYHLTHIRKNILNWYPFSKESSVLEIGCGLGAITGLLCDRCKDVTAVELSRRRATGTLLRCREKENLEIIVGNLNDIQFEKKYDYITLIGVLEYQGSYTDTENPYLDFLKKIKGLLKPDGKVLIAIENQYGLKYWCGAREDHTGLPFEGLNQYTISNNKVRTFSKSALDNLVKDSGFKNAFFYYPMPDYKLPTVIYSSKKLPANKNMMDMSYYYIPDGSTLIAQEENVYKDIIDNKVFEFFANSFLVECSDSSQLGEISFASLSSHRFKEYQTGTKFNDKGEVIKYAIQSNKGNRHLEQILRNEKELQERGLKVWSSALQEEELVMGYCDARTVEEVLVDEYHNKNINKIYEILDSVYEEILQSSVSVPWEDNILYTFGLGLEPDEEKYGVILKTAYVDMIPRNAFWIDGQICWFDQEYILENAPAKWVIYRALRLLYNSFPEIAQIVPMNDLLKRYELETVVGELHVIESLFYGSVLDQLHLSEYNGFAKNTREFCLDNISRLITRR